MPKPPGLSCVSGETELSWLSPLGTNLGVWHQLGTLPGRTISQEGNWEGLHISLGEGRDRLKSRYNFYLLQGQGTVSGVSLLNLGICGSYEASQMCNLSP